MNDDDYEYYFFDDLVARRIVGSRSDLSRKIRREEFPRPEKRPGAPMQARAPFLKSKVHAWLDRRRSSSEAAE